MFKKKFKLVTLLMATACAFSVAFAGCSNTETHKCEHECPTCHKCLDADCKDEVCKDKCEGHESESQVKYTGLFTYDREADGAHYLTQIVLTEEGEFWLVAPMINASKTWIGTYSYNADKTKLTLTATNGDDFDGEYDVEVNSDNKVVIKHIFVLNMDDGYYEDLIYDTVNTAPEKPIITLNKFIAKNDSAAYVEIKSQNTYVLKLNTPKIMSSGTYTETKNGNTTTYTLTDTLGEVEDNATFTFSYTYTETDGYTACLLKGTGLSTEGIEFIIEPTEKEVESTFKGTATNGTTTETFALYNYKDGTFKMDFTMFGNPGEATGTWALNEDYTKILYTVTGGNSKDMVKSLEGTNDFSQSQTNPTVTIAVTINIAQAYTEYSATLSKVTKMLTFSGTVTTDRQSEETVSLTHYSDNTFELTFTSFGANAVTVTGTYSANPDYTNTYTVTDGPVNAGVNTKDFVKSITMTLDQTYTASIAVSLQIPCGTFDLTYSVTLSKEA